jgi:hypothetical protein
MHLNLSVVMLVRLMYTVPVCFTCKLYLTAYAKITYIACYKITVYIVNIQRNNLLQYGGIGIRKGIAYFFFIPSITMV